MEHAANLNYTRTSCHQHLEGILNLQRANLPGAVSENERKEQGFVTVEHTMVQLADMHQREPHVIALAGDQVVAYLLAMTKASSSEIPVLIPMFKQFDRLKYKGRNISEYTYMIVGQVCIAKEYRGQGVLHQCYETYRNAFYTQYDFAITEIDIANTRSISAHARIGFREIQRFTDHSGTTWSIVVWDWS